MSKHSDKPFVGKNLPNEYESPAVESAVENASAEAVAVTAAIDAVAAAIDASATIEPPEPADYDQPKSGDYDQPKSGDQGKPELVEYDPPPAMLEPGATSGGAPESVPVTKVARPAKIDAKTEATRVLGLLRDALRYTPMNEIVRINIADPKLIAEVDSHLSESDRRRVCYTDGPVTGSTN